MDFQKDNTKNKVFKQLILLMISSIVFGDIELVQYSEGNRPQVIANSPIKASDMNTIFEYINTQRNNNPVLTTTTFKVFKRGELISRTILDELYKNTEIYPNQNEIDSFFNIHPDNIISSSDLNTLFNKVITDVNRHGSVCPTGSNWDTANNQCSIPIYDISVNYEVDLATIIPFSSNYSFSNIVTIHPSVSGCLNLSGSDGPEDLTCNIFNSDNTNAGPITLFRLIATDQYNVTLEKDFRASFNLITENLALDPVIEEQAIQILNKSPEESVSFEEVQTITSISQDNAGFTNLDGIEYFTNLETFQTRNGNTLTNIDSLSNLSNLNRISIINEPVQSLPDLSKNENLSDLTLAGTQITDISNVGKLDSVTTLNLDSTPVEIGFESIANMTQLTFLNLNQTTFKLGSDLSLLQNLTNLEVLSIEDHLITDISLLSGLTNLTSLNLRFNEVTDLSPLVTVTPNLNDFLLFNRNNVVSTGFNTAFSNLNNNATRIFVRAIDDADMNLLANKPNMVSISIAAENFTNVSSLSGLQFLNSLNLSTVNFVPATALDFTGLNNLPSLKTFTITDSNNGVTGLNAISSFTTIEVFSGRRSNISDISFLSPLVNLSNVNLEFNPLIDIEALRNKTNLKTLNLRLQNDTSTFQSFYNSFLSVMPTLTGLETLFFERNEILDEDLSVFINLPSLKQLNFTVDDNPATVETPDISCTSPNVVSLKSQGVVVRIDNINCP